MTTKALVSRVLVPIGLRARSVMQNDVMLMNRPLVCVEQRRWKVKKHRKGKKEVAPTVVEAEEAEDTYEDDDEEDDDEIGDMMGKAYGDQLKGRLKATTDRLSQQLSRMRGSAPTPELLDAARVEAYHSIQPLSAVAQVSVKSATALEVRCFDPEVSVAVQKGLLKLEGLSLNPIDNGYGVITIPFPKPSAEARALAAKNATHTVEQAKRKIRRIRDKARDDLKKFALDKTNGVSDDDKHRRLTFIDNLVSDAVKTATAKLEAKKEDILANA